MGFKVTFKNELNGDGGEAFPVTASGAFTAASEYLDRTGHGGMSFALDTFGDIFNPAITRIEFEEHNRKLLIIIERI